MRVSHPTARWEEVHNLQGSVARELEAVFGPVTSVVSGALVQIEDFVPGPRVCSCLVAADSVPSSAWYRCVPARLVAPCAVSTGHGVAGVWEATATWYEDRQGRDVARVGDTRELASGSTISYSAPDIAKEHRRSSRSIVVG
eukprot:3931643-Rhodomonas_salina.2